jgi:lipopolysaccharide export system permease protein
MFILLMFFLFKYIDDLIGKDIEWYTIAELMMYASASNVSMALPLAVLLSSIMTFGTLGENYELVAIKSAGISLQKAMRPLLVVIVLLSISSFFFSEYMLPKANLKYGSMLYDVRNKKLAFLIKPGVFNNSFNSYALLVERKGEGASDSLFNITIYDHKSNSGISQITKAERGRMFKTDDNQFLVLKLINGVRYEENNGSSSAVYNPRQTLTRMRFKQTEIRFDLSGFIGVSTDENSFKNNPQMQNRAELVRREDSLKKSLDSINKITKINAMAYYKQNTALLGYMKDKGKPKKIHASILTTIPNKNKLATLQSAFDQVETIKQLLNNRITEHETKEGDIIRTVIEYQRKYTLAASCLLLFFIGAPLGAIIRKGGLGLPVVIAVVFFLIYHIISTVAEKSAKEGSLDPVIGMWLAIIILTPLGIFLTNKATVDSAIFDADVYKQWFLRLFRVFKPKAK